MTPFFDTRPKAGLRLVSPQRLGTRIEPAESVASTRGSEWVASDRRARGGATRASAAAPCRRRSSSRVPDLLETQDPGAPGVRARGGFALAGGRGPLTAGRAR